MDVKKMKTIIFVLCLFSGYLYLKASETGSGVSFASTEATVVGTGAGPIASYEYGDMSNQSENALIRKINSASSVTDMKAILETIKTTEDYLEADDALDDFRA